MTYYHYTTKPKRRPLPIWLKLLLLLDVAIIWVFIYYNYLIIGGMQ